MSRIIAAGAALLALSACSVGIQPDGSAPAARFEVPVSYQEVHHRAVAQAEQCLRGAAGYPVTGGVDEASRTSQTIVRALLGEGRMAQVDARALSADRSEVTVAMWGRNIWDARAVQAMREAIEFGYVSCWPTMPVDDGKGNPR